MPHEMSRPLKWFTQGAAWMAWVALALQLYITLMVRWQNEASLLGGVVNFFSYFTILTNTLVAVVLTSAVVGRASRGRDFFRQPWVSSGVAVSIALVGLVYSLLLRDLWHPEGLQWWVNELLHDVLPPVFLCFWWCCVPKGQLRVRHVLRWMLYPTVYFAYSLLRGHVIGTYPYGFMDVGELGYTQVFINCLVILVGFIAMSLLLIGLDHWQGKRQAVSIS
ncbi:MAG: Pr6Pr family membrane protein [Pseudomonas sp.]|uniref:Pr6Pr family membrane protein n=1 Tax=Pseudomonas abieticivorans TaxID=2931382 RepID=UPI0020BE45DC|nr:Pr6Pr family membrane protein [Pseudomonas sp. PIA16]MDE1168027.1 Pr6Pr family membrane protein [Pseudomonas sp.]